MDEFIKVLSARLPELSWRLGLLQYTEFNTHKFPRGLFKNNLDMTPQSCIEEITEDLTRLSSQKNYRSAQYLAIQINKKVNVLVQMCHMSKDSAKIKHPPTFSVQTITTRQQWLASLTEDIAALRLQEQALTNRLTERDELKNSTVILNVQAEIGEIKRRLTLAQETLARATA